MKDMEHFKLLYRNEMIGLQEEMSTKWSSKSERKLAAIKMNYLFMLGVKMEIEK